MRGVRQVVLGMVTACLLAGSLSASATAAIPAAPTSVDPRTVPVASAQVPWARIVATDSVGQRILSAGGTGASSALRLSNLESLASAGTIPLQITEGDVQEIVVAGETAYLFSEGRVTVVDLSSKSILRRWRTVGARDFALDPGRGVIYALSRSFITSIDGQAPQWPAEYLVDVIDARSGVNLARWSIWRGQQAPPQVVPDTGDRLLLSADGRWLYAGLYGIGQVVKVDTGSGTPVATASVTAPIEAMAFAEPGLLWLGGGRVGALSLDLATLPQAAQVEPTATMLVADPTAQVAYVGSTQASQVEVLALPGLTPVVTVQVADPSSIATGPAGTFIVSSGLGEGTIVSRYSLDAKRAIPLQAAGPPQQVSAAVSGTTVEIRWTAPANASISKPNRYRVVAVPGERTCTTKGSRCSISGLRPGTRYRFRVQAGNRIGWGDQATSEAVLVPKAPPSRPDRPTPKPTAELS